MRRHWRRRDTSPQESAPVAFCEQSAALLGGGLPPTRLLASLSAGDGELPALLRRVTERVEGGARLPGALRAEGGPQWGVIAAAWTLAERSGAPLAPALGRIAAALRELDRLDRRRGILLAGPRSTVALVTVLPLFAVLTGQGIGFDPFGQLATPLGAMLLLVGALLYVAGLGWASLMIRRVRREDRVGGLELDLLWIALAAGHAPETAMRLVAESVDEVHVAWIPLSALVRSGGAWRILRLSEQTGMPVQTLVTAESDASRSRAHAELERRAEHLAVRVLIPLGVCVLPAFIVVGVIPVVLGMLT